MVWQYLSPIPVRRMGLISSFKLFLPAAPTCRERGGGGSAPCESRLSHSPTLLPGPWAPGTWASPSPAWWKPRPRQSPAAASPAVRGTSGTSSPAWRSHCTPRGAHRGRKSPGVLKQKREKKNIFVSSILLCLAFNEKRKISISFSVPDPWHFETETDPWIDTLDYVSGSGSCYFREWLSRWQKIRFF